MSPLGAGDFPFIIPLLREKESFVLLTHVNPDGDAIGSTLGLGLALRRLRKKVTLVGDLPEMYRFLPGSDLFVSPDQAEGEYDVAIFMDCADLDRAGAAKSVADRAKVKVNIDHHPTNTYFGDYNYVDVLVAAVGEQVYQILHVSEIALDQDIATCLYVAISTDTGGFRYENTHIDTHMIAASLLMEGVEPGEISNQVYETRSLASVRLLGTALETLKLSEDGQIGWLTVSARMIEETGAVDEDAEGLVNYARSVRGVEIGLLFREVGPDEVRVNFRSKSKVDVGRLAATLGGGGHTRAAGTTLKSSLPDAVERVLAAAQEALRQTAE